MGKREIPLLFYPPIVDIGRQAPLFVVIPGGGWSKSNASDMYIASKLTCDRLQEQGFAIAALSYRNHLDDGVNMRQIVGDIMDAAAWLSMNQERLHIDPHRMYTSGHSAGAHLGLMLAYADPKAFAPERCYDEPYTVRASAPLSPPTVLTPRSTYPLGFNVDHLFENCTDIDYALCSPPYWIDQGRGVPTLVAVGDRGPVVHPENGIDLAAQLHRAGIYAPLMVSHKGGMAWSR